MESVEKFFEKYCGLIGLILSLGGIVVSIISICANPNSFVIAVSIVSCQIIVFVMSLMCIRIMQKCKTTIKEVNEQKEKVVEQSEQDTKKSRLLLANDQDLIKGILLFDKNANKRFNSSLIDACDISDRFFATSSELNDTVDKITTMSDEEKNDMWARQICKFKENYVEDVYKLYNSYMSNCISETLSVVEKYLINKGYRLPVSISLKLFDRKYDGKISANSINVFTAFRDRVTYEQGKRELGEKLFKIDANSDFHKCMTKESYYKNNISKDCDDYMNENDNFSLYYNCVATVPIMCDYKSEKIMYGFLCCDTLNEEYAGQEIMDKNITNIMFSAALLIGSLFDTIDTNWEYVMEEGNEFLSYLRSKRCRRI